MAEKVRSKGTAGLLSISAVYTAVPNCKSINVSGHKSITYDSSVQSGPATKTNNGSGFSDAPTIDIEAFFDPADPVHVKLIELCTTQVVTNFKVTYADAAPTSKVYSCVGFGYDVATGLEDGVAITFTLQTSGDPT